MFDHDADIEAAQLAAAGDREAALERAGLCPHGHIQGPPAVARPRCLRCGKTFDNMEQLWAERAERLA